MTPSVRIALTAACAALTASFAQAATETVVHRFQLPQDGNGPVPGLAVDASGNIYGATMKGGTGNVGAIFRITPAGKENLALSFGLGGNTTPWAAPTVGPNGSLFGTTTNLGGGGNGLGAVYRITGRTITFLHQFGQSKKDGYIPEYGVAVDTFGNSYGVTSFSVAAGKFGNVWRVDPAGKETVLHTFAGMPDGSFASGAPILDAAGNLWGVTGAGGAYNGGTVYRITPQGHYSIIYSFGATPTDASSPTGGLIMDKSGNFYGAAFGGHANAGTIFKLTPGGVESVLHRFTPGAIDSVPAGPLAIDPSGNLYGVTTNFGELNGQYFAGTVFKLSANRTYTSLHTFSGASNSRDGAFPTGGPIFTPDGALVGTTAAGGGPVYQGTVYKIIP